MEASFRGTIGEVAWLLQHGADQRIEDNTGRIAFDRAESVGLAAFAAVEMKAEETYSHDQPDGTSVNLQSAVSLGESFHERISISDVGVPKLNWAAG
jgi:hypothetical protein